MPALTATPTAFETMPETMYLTATITESDTSMTLDYVPLAITSGVMILDEGLPNEERVSFGGVTDNGDGTATYTSMRRALKYGGGTAYAANQATAYVHTANSSTARLVVAHEFLNKMVVTDRASLLDASVELQFGATTQAIYGTSTELYFKSSTTAAKTLAQLAAANGSDEKVKASINDTTSKYLSSSLVAGDGITLTILNPAASETYEVKQNRAKLIPTAATTLTIASGVVTATQTLHKIDTESAASTDDLDTISGGSEGQIVIIRQANSGRSVVVKNGTGNIQIPSGDFTMSDGKAQIFLEFDGTNWRPIAYPAVSSVPQNDKTVAIAYGDSSTLGASSTADFAFDPTVLGSTTVPASDIINGVEYKFEATIALTWAAGNAELFVKLGSTKVLTLGDFVPTATTNIHVEGRITGTAAAGASVAVKCHGKFTQIPSGYTFLGMQIYNAPSLATNGTLAFSLGGAFRTSNAGNNMILKSFRLTRHSTTAS